MDRILKIYLLVLLAGLSCLAITPYLPFFGSAAPTTAGPPSDGLLFWLKADALVGYTNGQFVDTWPDSSGKLHSATNVPASTNCPTFTNATQGFPAVYFNPTNLQMLLFVTNTDWYSKNPTGGEYYVVVQALRDGSKAGTGAWFLCGQNDQNTYPNSAGTIADCTLRSANINTFPNPSLATNFHLYHVTATKSGANVLWTNFIDGTAIVGDAGASWNTNSGSGTGNKPKVGRSSTASYFEGWIAEFFAYTNNLSAADRTLLKQYITNKYPVITIAFP